MLCGTPGSLRGREKEPLSDTLGSTPNTLLEMPAHRLCTGPCRRRQQLEVLTKGGSFG